MLMNYSFEIVAWTVGPLELVIVGLVALLIFGNRIPSLAKSLGRSIVEFKKGLNSPDGDDPKALRNDQSDILPPPEKRNNNTAH
jgi:sec-independent protein translocase protein TatA